MKQIYLVLCLLFVGLASMNGQTDTSAVEADTDSDPYEEYARRFAINVNGGATGVGVGLAHNVGRHLNLKLRTNYFVVRDYEMTMEVSGKEVLMIAGFENLNLDLVLEYLPFKKSSFHLDAGLGYFIKYDPSVLILYNGEISYGEVTLDESSIGDISVDLSWAGISPFVGLGFGRAVPKKRVGLGLDAGVYYRGGGPQVNIAGTKMLRGNTTESQAAFVESFEQFEWIPYVNLSLKVKI